MGREIRRVPKDWRHPKDDNGNSKPLSDTYTPPLELLVQWVKEAGEHDRAECEGYSYSEWSSPPPDPDDYMYFQEDRRTHYQMYETTSGTPISPVFETPEEVATYCADNKVSWFGDDTATFDMWMRVATSHLKGHRP